MPTWLRAVVAAACVGVGAVLTVRPFTSVEVLVSLVGVVAIVTGVSELASDQVETKTQRQPLGVAWVLFGVAILVWSGVSVRALAIAVGVALVLSGIAGILRGIRGRSEERTADLIGGAASVAFGLVAVSWPDVTTLVVAVLFGARTVLFGLSEFVRIVKSWRRPATGPVASPIPPRPWRRGLRVGTRSVGLIVALALLALSVSLQSANGAISSFYDPPAALPAAGHLLRSEAYTTAVPGGARAWLILYSTETSLGKPAAGSAIVMASKHLPPGPRPVVLWDHGTSASPVPAPRRWRPIRSRVSQPSPNYSTAPG
jgi:uncharacterized membrane protein HdeD (DUF308 family)